MESNALGIQRYWVSLIVNAAYLVIDASQLRESSPARANSLLTYAEQEVGRAALAFRTFCEPWRDGSQTPLDVDQHGAISATEAQVLEEALMQRIEAAYFWDDTSELPPQHPDEDDHAYRQRWLSEVSEEVENELRGRDAGLLVHFNSGGGWSTPLDEKITSTEITARMRQVARMVEMQTIRCREYTESRDYLNELNQIQGLVLPYAHPDPCSRATSG